MSCPPYAAASWQAASCRIPAASACQFVPSLCLNTCTLSSHFAGCCALQVIHGIIAWLDAYGIGANDVANAFGELPRLQCMSPASIA